MSLSPESNSESYIPTSVETPSEVLSNSERLMALAHSGLLEDGDEALRRYTEIARAAIDAPMVAVSLVTSVRQVLQGAIGFGDIRETPIDASTCAIVVRSDEPVIVTDMSLDERTRSLAPVEGLVAGAYAGFPIRSPAGVLGTLCVLDSEPRQWTANELQLLERIAEAAQAEVLYRLDRGLRVRAEGWVRTQNRLLTAAIEGDTAEELADSFTEALADLFPGSGAVVVLANRSGHMSHIAVSRTIREHVGHLGIEHLSGTPAEQVLTQAPSPFEDPELAWGALAETLSALGLTDSVTLPVRDGLNDPLATVSLFRGRELAAAMRDNPSDLERGIELLRTLLSSAHARTRLARSEERLALALASTSEGMFDWYVAEDLLIVDDLWNELVGHPGPVRSSADWKDRIHPEDVDRSMARLERVLTGADREYESEHRVLKDDGEVVWIHARGRVVERGPDGEAIRMTGTFTDATQRKIQEFELERLSAAIANLNDAVLITDAPTGMEDRPLVRFANPAVARVLGREPADIIGRTAEELLASDPKHVSLIRQARRELIDGRPASLMLNLPRPDGGEIWVEVMVQPIRDTSIAQGFSVAVARDVTQRVEAEQELAASREQLRHAQKMEAVGRLAGGMAHDFNNLLTAILGYGEFISDEAPPGSSLRQDAAEIVGAASRGQAITRQLLAFSRKNAWNPSTFGLGEALQTVERLIHKIIGEDVNVMVLPTMLSGTVNMDRNQLEQAVLNLAINARDALVGGGTITLSTDSMVLGETLDAVPEPVPPGEYEVVMVRDDGVGISPALIQHIFEPFFTTKEAGKGTGLGLASVYGTVKQGDGFVTVDSQEGVGTTFRIFLPKSGEPTPLDRSGTGTLQPDFQGSETILVVEDEAQVRNLVVRILRHVGYQVFEAKHGADALLVWESHCSEIDLVITDVVMPEMGGAELAAILKEKDPYLPILFMSGYTGGTTDGRELSQKVSPEQLLPKPFNAPELLLAVRSRLDGFARQA